MRPVRSFATVAVLALVVMSCSSQRRATSATSVTNETTTTGATTTLAPPSTAAPTTVKVTTTTPAASSTTEPVVARGWTPVTEVPSLVWPLWGYEILRGEPSPPFPAPGGALADGIYAAGTKWAADTAQPLEFVLHLFEQCSVLPPGVCSDWGVPFESDQLGVDSAPSWPITVTLDEHVRVVLWGWGAIAQGNGSDLVELATAVDQAYGDVLASRFQNGEDPATIMSEVMADPDSGFSHPPDAFGPYDLVFTHGSAPPLMFQSGGDIRRDRGADVLDISSIEVTGGLMTVYVYAELYP